MDRVYLDHQPKIDHKLPGQGNVWFSLNLELQLAQGMLATSWV